MIQTKEPSSLTARKSNSLHCSQTPLQKSEVSPMLIETQGRHFKLNRRIFDLQSCREMIADTGKKQTRGKKGIVKNLPRVTQKREDLSTPARFYCCEKSDDYRRGRSKNCLILKENKFNAHSGFYAELLSKIPGGLSQKMRGDYERKTFEKPQNEKSNSLQRELLKELKFQSI